MKKMSVRYDYKNKCDCSDDDNCGCDFPNNMARNFSNMTEGDRNDDDITLENLVISCDGEHILEKQSSKKIEKMENSDFYG